MTSTAAQASDTTADDVGGDLETRAKALVNPTSGLANDYLNIFNELVMLVEQLPEIPEFADDILAWRPRSYEEYFRQSNLPGRQGALDAYARLERSFRDEFEAVDLTLALLHNCLPDGWIRILKCGHHDTHWTAERFGFIPERCC